MKNKKMMAMEKLTNLHNALNECGIEAELYEDTESNIISVRVDAWNCCDGSSVLVEVYAMEDEDYEIQLYAEPENDRKRFMEEIENL